MKTLRKTMMILLSLAVGFGCFACNSNTDANRTETVVKVMVYEGGYGSSWIYDSAARFAEKYKDEHFEEGKTGVYFDIKVDKKTGADSIASSAVDIFFTNAGQGGVYPNQYSQKGWLADIDDIVKEKIDTRDGVEYSIADKIDPIYTGVLTNRGNGHYYGLPYAESYPGLSYSPSVFAQNKWYFADESASNKELYESDFGDAYFVNSADAATGKSCGPDGEFGTSDDGLPSSIVEFLILCDRISESGYMPFAYPGAHSHYASMLVESLWASLAGKEKLTAQYNYTGSVDFVDDFTGTPLFEGIDYIYEPVVKTTGKDGVGALNASNGHYTTRTVERYYALSFMQICEHEGWFAQLTKDTNKNNISTQNAFINSELTGSEKIAMLIEGSYWLNESRDYGNIEDYRTLTKDPTAEPDVAWMSLPVNLKESVTEGNGKKQTFISAGGDFAFINARTENKSSGVLKAAKKFLQFTYTDEELSHYTGKHGVRRMAIDYEVSKEDKDRLLSFEHGLTELVEKSDIIYTAASNRTFLDAMGSLSVAGGLYNMPTHNNVFYSNLITPIRAGITAEELFDDTTVPEIKWGTYYKAE